MAQTLKEPPNQTRQTERALGLTVAVLVAVLATHWQTSLSIVELWGESSTYSHGFLIVPVFLWLVWQRRLALAQLPMRPSWAGLFVLAALGLGWLIGNLVSLNGPTQFAVVAMVPVALATVLGSQWVRALAFPLVFLFFAVPLGDSLIPIMMDWTADFTVSALKLTGVPVYREGNNFSIPSGDWSVIEACSGIRYFFACLTVATLYAWSAYQTTARRLLFIGAALAVAVVANWVRAYSIVMLAHFSDNRLATGVDHFIYGGVFFGVIMVMLFSLGSIWREERTDSATANDSASSAGFACGEPPGMSAPRQCLGAALAALAVLCIWPLVSLATQEVARGPVAEIGDVEPRAGWIRVDEPAASWQPQLTKPSRVKRQTFMKTGQRVSVFIAVFDRSTRGSKATASVNQLVAPQDPHWKQVERGVAELRSRSDAITVGTGTLVGSAARVVAWHWYWVDGTLTSSPARAVLCQILARLRGRSDLSAWMAVYALEDERTASAPLLLDAFLSDMLDSIDQAMQVASADSGL